MKHTAPQNRTHEQGTSLLVVIVLGVVGIMVVTMGLALSITATQSNATFIENKRALLIAESAAENALLRLLRDPSYTGETLTIDGGTATIGVTGTTNKIIDVSVTVGTTAKTLQVQTTEVNGITTVSSWNEVY
jgi:hypothetical protein